MLSRLERVSQLQGPRKRWDPKEMFLTLWRQRWCTNSATKTSLMSPSSSAGKSSNATKCFIMGSNENPGYQLEHMPKVYKFGDFKTSDVIFAVGTQEFRCHKKVLSDHSSYFKAMFFSEFKEKDQSRFQIDEDHVAFRMLLELIYTGFTDLHREFICCRRRSPTLMGCTCRKRPSKPYRSCCSTTRMWIRCLSLLELADKYDVLEKTAKFVEEHFLQVNRRRRYAKKRALQVVREFGFGSAAEQHFLQAYPGIEFTEQLDRGGSIEVVCHCDGIRLVIAMLYRLNTFKERSRAFRTVAEVIPTIKEVQPDFRIHADQLLWLLKTRRAYLPVELSSVVEPKEILRCSSSLRPIVHKFGIEELSDVTFVVGGEKFRCHKMFLAARSTYFKKMFTSNSEKANTDVVFLEEDAVVFSQLMEILYNDSFIGWQEIFGCHKCQDCALNDRSTQPACPVIPKLWKTCNSLVNLADSLGVRDHVVTVLDNCFFSHNSIHHQTNKCSCDGAKFVFAAMHGLYEYKNSVSVARNAVLRALCVVMKLEPKLSFDLDTFQLLMTKLSFI